jgi:hypothetical protein
VGKDCETQSERTHPKGNEQVRPLPLEIVLPRVRQERRISLLPASDHLPVSVVPVEAATGTTWRYLSRWVGGGVICILATLMPD